MVNCGGDSGRWEETWKHSTAHYQHITIYQHQTSDHEKGGADRG